MLQIGVDRQHRQYPAENLLVVSFSSQSAIGIGKIPVGVGRLRVEFSGACESGDRFLRLALVRGQIISRAAMRTAGSASPGSGRAADEAVGVKQGCAIVRAVARMIAGTAVLAALSTDWELGYAGYGPDGQA